jgi:hypothetical protein
VPFARVRPLYNPNDLDPIQDDPIKNMIVAKGKILAVPGNVRPAPLSRDTYHPKSVTNPTKSSGQLYGA